MPGPEQVNEYTKLLQERIARERESDRIFAEAVTKLQSECSHEDQTGWLWGGTGYYARLCKRCSKVIEEEYVCHIPNR